MVNSFLKKKLATADRFDRESRVSLGLSGVQHTLSVHVNLLETALPMKNFGALLGIGIVCSGEMADVFILNVFIHSFHFIQTFWACLTGWSLRSV